MQSEQPPIIQVPYSEIQEIVQIIKRKGYQHVCLSILADGKIQGWGLLGRADVARQPSLILLHDLAAQTEDAIIYAIRSVLWNRAGYSVTQ